MKSKIALAMVVLMVLSTAVALYSFSYSTASEESSSESFSTSSFTITASGTANLKPGDSRVPVSLSITGTAQGFLNIIVRLNVDGGDLSVHSLQTVSVLRGSGIIIPFVRYLQVSLVLTTDYFGGSQTSCFLVGRILTASGNMRPITLTAPWRIVLPLEGNPYLTDLSLRGTITYS
ncbi:MAG: hypothetical protein ACE14S_04180 [Candidatus Bathyarchaeia archaeon]